MRWLGWASWLDGVITRAGVPPKDVQLILKDDFLDSLDRHVRAFHGELKRFADGHRHVPAIWSADDEILAAAQATSQRLEGLSVTMAEGRE